MNYYIKGDKERAEEIKAAFEKKGVGLPIRRSCADDGLIYFLLDGEVFSITIKAIELFKKNPDYQELELPVEPCFKVGDWLAANEPNNYARFVYIEGIEDSLYLISKIGGAFGSVDRPCITFVEEYYHPFSINDAKDGDVLVDVYGNISIYEKCDDFDWMSYCSLGHNGGFQHFKIEHENEKTYPATKEQRDLLFTKMWEAGYEWDADKKELKKIQPHYDIANFQPFDKVLVRDRNNEKWRCAWFSDYEKTLPFPFITTGADYKQCIPFNDDTKHLLGTTDMPSEEFINW